MQMLTDFCKSMPTEKVLGISYPISPSMYEGKTDYKSNASFTQMGLSTKCNECLYL